MSDTDKTKPWRIRVMEHQPWANHDHADGICDLPRHYKDNAWYSTESGATHCRWSDWNISYRGGTCCFGCGCKTCTDQVRRKAKRRRERHAARQAARRAVTGIDPDPVISRDRGW